MDFPQGGIAVKSNLWPDLGQASDQSEVTPQCWSKQWRSCLTLSARRATRGSPPLHSIEKTRSVRFPSNPRRNQANRQRPRLDSTQVQSRLICAGDVVLTNTMRALFSPLYASQRRCPLTSLANGAKLEEKSSTASRRTVHSSTVDIQLSPDRGFQSHLHVVCFDRCKCLTERTDSWILTDDIIYTK